MQILQLIIAVKREQTFCSNEDSQIFMKNFAHSSSKKSLDGSASKTSKSSRAQQIDDKALETEEQIMLLNIDYFELWDRVFQKFDVEEKEVQNSFKANGIKML